MKKKKQFTRFTILITNEMCVQWKLYNNNNIPANLTGGRVSWMKKDCYENCDSDEFPINQKKKTQRIFIIVQL